jgi:alkylation response protein AidB-like acyl-CoA dehydrogenase
MWQAPPMDFALSEQQLAFRDNLRRFVDRSIRPVAREYEHDGRYPTEIVRELGEMGLFGITIPPEHGGLGLSLVDLALVFEEISRGWMGIAGVLGSHTLACRMIARWGTEEQQRRYLPELATGARRTGIALTEAGAGSDLQGIQTRAWRDGDEWVIRGTKYWITNARYADPLPVLVKTDPEASPRARGISVFLVPASSPGFSVSRDIGKLGYKGPESCEVVLDDVRVPHDALLGGVTGMGLPQVLGALEAGRINIAARSVGVSQRAYDEALAYSQQRHAFGQPISGFQAVQMKLADMATDIQAARLITWWAANQADLKAAAHPPTDDASRADVETGMAKLFASEVALRTTLESMRIHGGAGYSTEMEIERLYRDAPLLAIGEGTNDILRGVIARGLLSRRVVID